MSTNNVDQMSLGRAGSVVFDDSDALPTGSYCAIQAVTDIEFDSLTAPKTDEIGKFVGPTIPAGTVLFLQATAASLASGVAIAYRETL